MWEAAALADPREYETLPFSAITQSPEAFEKADQLIPSDWLQINSVKRDALWKKLFRSFRRYLQSVVKREIGKKSFGLGTVIGLDGYGKLLAWALGVPADMAEDKRTQAVLFIMVES